MESILESPEWASCIGLGLYVLTKTLVWVWLELLEMNFLVASMSFKDKDGKENETFV